MERIRPEKSEKNVCYRRLRQNEFYVFVAGFTGFLLIAGILYDIITYTALQSPLQTTQTFSYLILVLHVVTFILSIAGFVHSTLRYQTSMDRISFALIVCNGFSFVARISLELVFVNYRVEYYN